MSHYHLGIEAAGLRKSFRSEIFGPPHRLWRNPRPNFSDHRIVVGAIRDDDREANAFQQDSFPRGTFLGGFFLLFREDKETNF